MQADMIHGFVSPESRVCTARSHGWGMNTAKHGKFAEIISIFEIMYNMWHFQPNIQTDITLYLFFRII